MHLEDAWAHFEPKSYVNEPIFSLEGIESGHKTAGFIQVNTLEPILSIEFGKKIGSTQAVRDLSRVGTL